MQSPTKRHIVATVAGFIFGISLAFFSQGYHLGNLGAFNLSVSWLIMLTSGVFGIVLGNAFVETFYGVGIVRKLAIVTLILLGLLVGYSSSSTNEMVYYCNGVAVGNTPPTSCN